MKPTLPRDRGVATHLLICKTVNLDGWDQSLQVKSLLADRPHNTTVLTIVAAIALHLFSLLMNIYATTALHDPQAKKGR